MNAFLKINYRNGTNLSFWPIFWVAICDFWGLVMPTGAGLTGNGTFCCSWLCFKWCFRTAWGSELAMSQQRQVYYGIPPVFWMIDNLMHQKTNHHSPLSANSFGAARMIQWNLLPFFTELFNARHDTRLTLPPSSALPRHVLGAPMATILSLLGIQLGNGLQQLLPWTRRGLGAWFTGCNTTHFPSQDIPKLQLIWPTSGRVKS